MRAAARNIDGGFVKQEQTPNNHPAWYNVEDDTAIWWAQGVWMLTKGKASIGATQW